MSDTDPYTAPAAGVTQPPRGAGAPGRWRGASALLCLLQAAMAAVWIAQDGGVMDMFRNGDLNAITATPHLLSPILLVIGVVLQLARRRGAAVVFAIAAGLSATALLGWWRPLIAVTAVAIPAVAAGVSFHDASRRVR